MKNMYTLGTLTFFALLTAPLSAQTPWKEYTPPFGDTIAIADIKVVNENVIWAVGLRLDVNDSLFNYFFPSKTYVALTQDGGATWSVDTVPMGVNPFVASMTALDGSTAWVSGLSNYGNSKLLKTTNGGKTWKDNSPGFDPINSSKNQMKALTLHPLISLDGFIVAAYLQASNTGYCSIPSQPLPILSGATVEAGSVQFHR